MELSKLFICNDHRHIDALVLDSRDSVSNGLFFCLEGLTVDGHDFADKAIENGCVAVVHHKDLEHYHEGVVYIRVEDAMSELHRVSNVFFDNPSRKCKHF